MCSRYVGADSQRYSYKNMLQKNAGNLHKGVPVGAFPTPLIALPCFHLLNCKRLLQVVGTYATRSISIEAFKMFKQSFNIFKPEVLKAASFRR